MTPPEAEPTIRPARDGDAEGLIALIASCFSEYEGCILDVDGEEPALRAIATAYRKEGGGFWVVERSGEVVGSVGFVPRSGGLGKGVELRKLYVARAERRRGLGRRLCRLVEERARESPAAFVELWSDTRFREAHRLYEDLGYERTGRRRELHDRSRTVEIHFVKRLGGEAPDEPSIPD